MHLEIDTVQTLTIGHKRADCYLPASYRQSEVMMI